MPRRQSRSTLARWRAVLLLLGLNLLSACGGKPMPFPVPDSEMGDRAGLLTGERGAWDLLHDGARLAQAPQP